MKIVQKLLSTLLLLTSVHTVQALEIVLSEKPVKIPLPKDKEIVIKFPHAVTHTEILKEYVGKTDSLRKFLRPDGVLLLKAGQPFGEVRMIAPMVNGDVVILDLDASIGAINHETIRLIEPKSLKQIKPKQKTAEQPPVTVAQPKKKKKRKPKTNPNKPAFLQDGAVMTKSRQQSGAGATNYGEMVQFGFRHFVGPSRLIGHRVKGKKVTVTRTGLSRFVRMSNKRLRIKPLAQWKISDKYLTVLKVDNLSAYPMPFDPRALRGRIITASALHPVLQPQGSVSDQTLWAIITGIPFNKAIIIR